MSDPSHALAAWDDGPSLRAEPAPSGLINSTWVLASGRGPVGVIQSLNTAIFDPALHENIEAVTARLAARDLATPRLVRTRSGDLWHSAADGAIWRRLTWVGDRTVDKLASPADAREAGRLVARFHAATHDLDWAFRPIWAPALAASGTRSAFHDTGAYVARLAEAVPRHRDHRLYDAVARLSAAIVESWARWDGPRGLPERVVHGDLKISNVRFQGPLAIALIDLDTLSRGTLDAELGDALRSWCNPASEDAAEPRFDLDLFEAAVAGYAEGAAISDLEWASIAPGVERIALELAARFCRDAVEESYFGWNPKHGGRGEHNLLRARGQYALARAVRAARSEAEAVIRRVRGG